MYFFDLKKKIPHAFRSKLLSQFLPYSTNMAAIFHEYGRYLGMYTLSIWDLLCVIVADMVCRQIPLLIFVNICYSSRPDKQQDSRLLATRGGIPVLSIRTQLQPWSNFDLDIGHQGHLGTNKCNGTVKQPTYEVLVHFQRKHL